MSLSIKRMQEDPWKVVADKFSVGDKISGPITNITDFGIFVQLYDGVDGLVHISDISWTEHIVHPADRYKSGDLVDVTILSIDPENKKISLGIKQLDPDPWENIAEEYPIGKTVTGTISKVTNFGAFVKLASGIEGLVHVSELSSKEVEKVEDVVQVGQEMQFKVIKSNKEERKLGLSLRAITEPGSPRPVERKSAPRTTAPKRVSTGGGDSKDTGSMKSVMQRAFEEHAKRSNDDKDEE